MRLPAIAACCGLAILGPVNGAFARGVGTERLLHADQEPGQWLSTGRNYDEQRFSPLKQVTTENVARLGLAWSAPIDSNRGQEATPLVIDGVLYVSTAWSKVKAVDARSGKLLWSFDPKVPPEWGIRGCCDVVNRGLAAWGNKIFLGTYDGRLIALDARSGKPVWETNTIDRAKAYSITGAPRVVKGKVIIGNAGSEIGVRGYLSAYDAVDGKLAWRFYTVPGDPSKPFETPQLREAAKTWKGDKWWTLGGGGTVWDGIAYDPALNLLYFGTSNGTPWVANVRSPGGGDNLFLNSIIAVNADTGAYAWHYQVTPSETWDFDATNQLTLANLKIGGADRRIVMQASKNGFFYVLDAAKGTLLSADKYTTVNWATHVDLASGRPVEVLEARYDVTGKPFIAQPGAQGAHSWHPMSFSPRTGLIYTPVVENSYAYNKDPKYQMREMGLNGGTGAAPATVYEDLHSTAPRTASGVLLAWDPVGRKEVWRASDLGRVGSGVLSTAGGLVFQGTPNGELRAYRDSDGTLLWSAKTQAGVVAAPISYQVGGVQYVAQLAGYGTRDYYSGNESRLLVYRLDGKASLPPPAPLPPARTLNPVAQFATADDIEQGRELFVAYCSMCHETPGANRGLFPDLRFSPMINTPEAFRTIVLDGALQPRGMVSFKDKLQPSDAEAVRAYLTQRAIDAVAIQKAGGVVR